MSCLFCLFATAYLTAITIRTIGRSDDSTSCLHQQGRSTRTRHAIPQLDRPSTTSHLSATVYRASTSTQRQSALPSCRLPFVTQRSASLPCSPVPVSAPLSTSNRHVEFVIELPRLPSRLLCVSFSASSITALSTLVDPILLRILLLICLLLSCSSSAVPLAFNLVFGRPPRPSTATIHLAFRRFRGLDAFCSYIHL